MTKKEGKYHFDDGSSVSAGGLKRMGYEKQTEAMRNWFRDNYRDPNILPYDSGEGGYQWIWGGPYDAREELQAEFEGIVKDKSLDALVEELEEENWEWSGNPDNYEPDEDSGSFETFLRYASKHDVLMASLYDVEIAVENKSPSQSEQFIRMLLFANVVTAMESYLSDRFRQCIFADANLLQRFVETFPELKQMQIPLSAVSETSRNMEKVVANHLSKVVWHRIEKVSKMYADTLNVKFPNDLTLLKSAIQDRHDIVHRNGLSEDGVKGNWDKDAIKRLVAAVKKMADQIESQLKAADNS